MVSAVAATVLVLVTHPNEDLEPSERWATFAWVNSNSNTYCGLVGCPCNPAPGSARHLSPSCHIHAHEASASLSLDSASVVLYHVLLVRALGLSRSNVVQADGACLQMQAHANATESRLGNSFKSHVDQWTNTLPAVLGVALTWPAGLWC